MVPSRGVTTFLGFDFIIFDYYTRSLDVMVGAFSRFLPAGNFMQTLFATGLPNATNHPG